MIVFWMMSFASVFAQESPVNLTTAPAPSAQNAGMEAVLTEEMIRTLRDPFRPPNFQFSKEMEVEKPKSDLEMFSIKEIKLNGVLSGGKKSKALVSLPNAKTIFVSVGDRIGIREGKVLSISGDSVSVIEYDYDESGKKVPERYKMLISGELVSLENKGTYDQQ